MINEYYVFQLWLAQQLRDLQTAINRIHSIRGNTQSPKLDITALAEHADPDDVLSGIPVPGIRGFALPAMPQKDVISIYVYIHIHIYIYFEQTSNQ